MNTPAIAVGDVTTINGADVKIFKIHPAGTIDVVTLDGSRAFRVSGLSFTVRKPKPAKSSKIPVTCQECGKKFKAAYFGVECPKCGGTDIDVREDA